MELNVPQIQITTSDIKMNRQVTDASVKIQQPQAEITMEQPAAILEINTTPAKLEADMSQFWRDVGLKKTGELISEFAQQGTQTALQGMSRRVNEGRQMMLSAGKGQGANTIKSIAMERFGPKRPGPYNIGFIPSYQAIKIHNTPGTTDINIEAQPVKYDAKVNKPIIDYRAGNISSEMNQRPDVQIDVRA